MSILTTLRESAAPAVAVEIAAGRVSAASLDWRGGQPVVAAHASELLPDGALVPSLTATNAVDRAAVTDALSRLLEKVGRPRRIGLILPDVVGRVSLVRFEQVPARTQDLDQLVRWQVRKSAPFAIEDAQVSYVPGLSAADGHEFVVTLAKRDVIQEYEQLCASAGAQQASDIDELRRSLEERLRTPVESVDPRTAAALTDRIVAAPALLDTLTPLVGLLLRDRAEVQA